ncbi:patatin-like phospholipase family protein [Spirulina major CS-329]|uniref:patatin-like phospholipase family protein n=1 Tax=Spirulina TaxID=1154 RepID=UPI00232B5139|nr:MULTISPECIES: patatin-like phospholipase family protein [Spirulina]MDB9495646.1 patatin-like phospholipase family protein [Spirulina subsalsa CS-330]MDB9503967.1 patatin-like phospholipase family protein [Spirulina major CS-329]
MTYRILSLDGGGFRGVMSARILVALEQELRHQYDCALHEYFDLVTGTSTGSILATGIALKKTAHELLGLYEKNGEHIFPGYIRTLRSMTNITRSFLPIALYPHSPEWPLSKEDGVATVLAKEFGSTSIAEITSPVLLIPAYDTSVRRTRWFCSNNDGHNQPQWYDTLPVWQLCVCSSSAPTFFPPYELTVPEPQYEGQPTVGKKLPFIDGGVAVNNPVLVGMAHAMLMPYETPDPEQLTLKDMVVLSVGTGRPTEPYSYDDVKRWGALQWVARLGDLFLPAPNDVNANVCWQLIRGESDENAQRVLRLDYSLDQKLADIDNPELYHEYVKFAEQYLHGQTGRSSDLARVGISEAMSPETAIAQFVAANPPA